MSLRFRVTLGLELGRGSDVRDNFWRLGGECLTILVPGRCAVFYYEQSTLDAAQTPIKLRRSETTPAAAETRLFDYCAFVTALKDFLDERGPKPDPHCVLVLGQALPFCRRDDSAVLVSVTLATTRALRDLEKAEAAVSRMLSPVASRQWWSCLFSRGALWRVKVQHMNLWFQLGS